MLYGTFILIILIHSNSSTVEKVQRKRSQYRKIIPSRLLTQMKSTKQLQLEKTTTKTRNMHISKLKNSCLNENMCDDIEVYGERKFQRFSSNFTYESLSQTIQDVFKNFLPSLLELYMEEVAQK